MATRAESPARPDFRRLDEGGVTRFQWKIMLVAGMGFFTDAYDLFVIGVVVALLTSQWHLSTAQVSLLNSVTLGASAFGALAFGRVADLLGRKRIYGLEVLILGAGALASALSPNFTFLLVSRLLIGIGIGGDYPLSATIMSEYSGKRSRGRMVGLVFAMQGAGLVVGPLLASILLGSGLSSGTAWRVLLGVGAIPGLAVFYLRRKIYETPRFAAASGATDEANAAVALATGASASMATATGAVASTRAVASTGVVARPASPPPARSRASLLEGFVTLARHKRLALWLLGTTGAWMLLDFSYYGNSISSPEILKLLSPHATLLANTLLQLAIFLLFAVPGYAVAVLVLDKAGRKLVQVLGFGIMALCFLVIGMVPVVTTAVVPFVALYGVSYFFTEFGPNTTTFVYPAEIYPLQVRTTGHGISAAAGKIGAFAGAYLFPAMLASSMKIRGAEMVAGAVSLAGLVLTALLLPEPKGKSLEELELEAVGGDLELVLEAPEAA